MQTQHTTIAVRANSLPTTSYVAGNIIKLPGLTRAGVEEFTQLLLYLSFTKASSTSLEFKIEFADKLLYAIAYDGQTANFTVGKTITGAKSGATARIVQDTDGGATGTLVVATSNGKAFHDNETITDDNSTPGTAVVNGAVDPATAAPDDLSFYQESGESYSAGVTTQRENIRQIVSANQASATQRYRFSIPINDSFIRVSTKVTGTATASAVGIDAIIATN